jgi:hypothetical protein
MKVIVLLRLRGETPAKKTLPKDRVDKRYGRFVKIETHDLNRALHELASEGLVTADDAMVQLTEQGANLSTGLRGLLLKREPILEVVSGLADGSITAPVAILSSVLAGLAVTTTTFAHPERHYLLTDS